MKLSSWLLPLLILASCANAFHLANAQEYSVIIHDSSVQVRIALNLQQNLTLLDPSFTLPTSIGYFSPENSSSPASLVASAITPIVPGGRLENFSIVFRSTPWSNKTNTQSFYLVISFRLVGAASSSGGLFSINTKWKSFKVVDDIVLNKVSINRIGERYLAAPADAVAGGQPTSGPGGVIVRVGAVRLSSSNIRQGVAGLVVLDFSSLAKPISEWDRSRDYAGGTTSFRFNQEVRRLLTVAPFITEVTGFPTETPYTLGAKFDAEFKANGVATSKGDLLTVDSGNSYGPSLMTLIIGVVAGALFSSSLLERRLSPRPYRRPRRRP